MASIFETNSAIAPGICFHCGLDIPENIEVTAELNDTKKHFCCHACKTVFELISAGGLDNYYQFRTEFADKAVADSKNFGDFDNANFQAGFCQNASDDSIQAHLYIDGIHCAACVWLIEKSLSQLKGITNVDISLVDNAALVTWSNQEARLSKIVKHIHQLGYSASPWSQDNKQTLQEQTERKLLRKVGLAGIVMMQVGMFSIGLYASEQHGMESEYKTLLHAFSALLTTVVILYSAQTFFMGAWRSLKHFSINMDVPIALALAVAWIASIIATVRGQGDVYFDSVCMFVFLLSGVRYLELRARNKYTSIKNQGVIPGNCKRITDINNYNYEYVSTQDIVPGQILYIQKGETVPIDGNLASESALLNEASINGEFTPVEKFRGDTILSGAINQSPMLLIEVEKLASQSCLQSLQRLALQVRSNRPDFLRVTDIVARYFSFAVLLLSITTGIVWYFVDAHRALSIVIAMLVISCPCALSLAAPTAFTVVTNYLRKQGILVCNGDTLEKLNTVSIVAFDKTGTLTLGEFVISGKQYFTSIEPDQVDSIAHCMEIWSEHPLARAFDNIQSFKGLVTTPISDIQLISSEGISGKIDTQEIRIGSKAFCKKLTAVPEPNIELDSSQTLIWLASEREWLACYQLRDVLREDACETIKQLKQDTLVISGDSEAAVAKIAKEVGIGKYYSRCSPEEKMEHIHSLQNLPTHGRPTTTVMMVGDGLNDLPVLAQADVSVAMNSANHLAQIQADCVLLNNKLSSLEILFRKAKDTHRIVRQNITWALVYNFTALPFAGLGYIPPWAAALGMSASSLLVILNAARLSRQ